MLGCFPSGESLPVSVSQRAKAIMGTSPSMPIGARSREFPLDSNSKPRPACALSSACAMVEGQILPEDARSQAKMTLREVVNTIIMRMPRTGWPG